MTIAHLTAQPDAIDQQREAITTDLKLLPVTLREVQAQREKLAWMTSTNFWDHLTPHSAL